MRPDRTGLRELQLGALQSEFAAAVLNSARAVPPSIAGRNGAQRRKRFAVYRNNVKASLSTALAARFPVVQRLVGEEFFRALAVRFVEIHPPRSPILAEFGLGFPDFLDNLDAVAELPYLGDVAYLEWLRGVAYHAADEVPLDASTLAAVDPAAIEELRVWLHPSVGFLASDYPVVSIWATNTHDERVVDIGPQPCGEAALVSRPGLDVLVTKVPASTVEFVAQIAEGASLGDAFEETTRLHATFDLAESLSLMVGAGAVIALEPEAGKWPDMGEARPSWYR